MIALLAVGSSPLARGLPGINGRQQLGARIIPARAGFTRDAGVVRHPREDHPRSRGVYENISSTKGTPMGSSPLARGLRHAPAHADGRGGIIPARAGFTPGRPRRDQLREDYPRSRGVYSAMSSRMTSRAGSSPLARGLHGDSTPSGASLGIIPARAGFTMRWARVEARRSDHPRSRGVYFLFARIARPSPGSSPLARGLRCHQCRRGGVRRDHPRSRGVYMAAALAICSSSGSSPLARGLPLLYVSGSDGAGIIPARAGFTRKS